MRPTLCVVSCLFATISADAGVIKGSVIEQASGRPLARSAVRLQPIPAPVSGSTGNTAKPLQTRADSSGAFTFPAVPDGLYLIIATRTYYFPAAFGQRRPNGQGTPVQVTADSNLFAELHMRRMGVITGQVLDENDIGMPTVPVVAYRARFPLNPVGRGIADDRGIYRIFNLQPGKYWVRTAAHTQDDGSSWLPTFGPESRETREARIHEVRVDQEAAFANLRPMPGRLFQMSGRIVCPEKDAEGRAIVANVTLSSEPSGRRRKWSAVRPTVLRVSRPPYMKYSSKLAMDIPASSNNSWIATMSWPT